MHYTIYVALSKRQANAKCPVSVETWGRMLEAYKSNPTLASVMQAGGISRRVAHRAIVDGWLASRLPSFTTIVNKNSALHEMVIMRECWEQDQAEQSEAARVAAEEAMAARIVMQSALNAVRLSQKFAEETLKKIDSGEYRLPDEIGPKLMLHIIRSLNASADIVKKAVEIERLRVPEVATVLSVQIGAQLENCSLEELTFVAKTGSLPKRIADRRKFLMTEVEHADGLRAVSGAINAGYSFEPASDQPAKSEHASTDATKLSYEPSVTNYFPDDATAQSTVSDSNGHESEDLEGDTAGAKEEAGGSASNS